MISTFPLPSTLDYLFFIVIHPCARINKKHFFPSVLFSWSRSKPPLVRLYFHLDRFVLPTEGGQAIFVRVLFRMFHSLPLSLLTRGRTLSAFNGSTLFVGSQTPGGHGWVTRGIKAIKRKHGLLFLHICTNELRLFHLGLNEPHLFSF